MTVNTDDRLPTTVPERGDYSRYQYVATDAGAVIHDIEEDDELLVAVGRYSLLPIWNGAGPDSNRARPDSNNAKTCSRRCARLLSFESADRSLRSRRCSRRMRGTGFEPNGDGRACSLRSLRALRLPGFEPARCRACASRSARRNHARDRIRTGGPLQDSVLSAAPLAWLGYPRSATRFAESSKNLSIHGICREGHSCVTGSSGDQSGGTINVTCSGSRSW